MGEQMMRKALVASVVLAAVTGAVPVPLLAGGPAHAASAVAPRLFAYLPNSGTSLQVLDMQTGVTTRPVPGFSAPSSVALLADGTHAYVTNSGGQTISVLGPTAVDWFPIAEYSFDFGDGEHLTQRAPHVVHPYAHAGTYTVQLTVSDEFGLTSTTTAQVTVRAVATGIALLAPSNDRYVTAGDAGTQPLRAERTQVGAGEQFDLIDIDGTNVALRAR